MLPYEEVLTIMGIVFFLVLLFLLIWNVIKQRSVTLLLPFFLVPVIMVAFPTLQSVKVGDIVINVKELTKKVQDDPSDTAAVQELKENLAQLKDNERLFQNDNALLAVANAQIALGRYDSASLYLHKAERINPESEAVFATKNDLNEKLKVRENFSNKIIELNTRIDHLKQVPQDTQTVYQIAKALSEIQMPTYLNPNEMTALAKSYAIIGDRQQSLQILGKLEAAGQPSDINVNNLKDSIQNNSYQRQFFKGETAPKAPDMELIQNKNLLNKTVIYHTR